MQKVKNQKDNNDYFVVQKEPWIISFLWPTGNHENNMFHVPLKANKWSLEFAADRGIQ